MSTATTDPGRTGTGDTFAVHAAAGLATFLLLFTLAFGLFEIGDAVVGFAHGREVTFQAAVSVHTDDERKPSFVDEPGVADATVHLRDASARQQTLALIRDLTPVLMFAAGAWLLRGLLVSARRGDPFSERNVWRLRGIGVLIMLLPVVQIAQHYLDNALASTVPEIHGGPNGGDIAVLNGPVVGLVVLALAEVFAFGVRLRDDVEGTV